jgi:hypothetical protein
MTVKHKLKGENIFNVQIIILHHFAFVAKFITIQADKNSLRVHAHSKIRVHAHSKIRVHAQRNMLLRFCSFS